MNTTELKRNTKRITLCGSTKFKKEFEAINRQLTLEGNVVYTVAFFGHADSVPLTVEQKETLDAVHLKKIDNSDAIFVVDVDGYIGDSTQKEINYAELQGKTVKYLSQFPDLKMLCDSVTLSFSPATPPNAAGAEDVTDDELIERFGLSPSELTATTNEPVAEDAEGAPRDKKKRCIYYDEQYDNKCQRDDCSCDTLSLVEWRNYHIAKAVEDERARLRGLVEEHLDYFKGVNLEPDEKVEVAVLEKFRTWLAG